MHPISKAFCIIALLLLCHTTSFAQNTKDTTSKGLLTGTIRDSAYNFDLQSATLTVFKYVDTSLVSYSLANNFGEYSFSTLPFDTDLLLVASFNGYKTQRFKINISKEKGKVTLPTINMERSEGDTLNEVIVKTVAPIQMNGDTLEFNADAFHLDKNAVVEDLLRKIPNVTVWGDGSITVNGKEISSLKVNGKPFLGGDSKLALQNISKGAVDKIQVYQVSKSETNLMDSTSEINIKLKSNKTKNQFGKIGGGIGTKDRYQVDANYNITSDNTQIGIVAAMNNVNEQAGNVTSQLRNGTFRGVNASPEYQPDFSKSGINKYKAAGIKLQHDFVDKPTYSNTERLNAEYFIRNNIENIDRNSNTLTRLTPDSSQTSISTSQSRNETTSNSLSSSYEKRKNQNNWSFNLNGNTNNSNSNNKQERKTLNNQEELVSSNTSESRSTSNNQNINLTGSLSHSPNWTSEYKTEFPRSYDLNYSFSTSKNNSTNNRITNFTAANNPSLNQFVNRLYINENTSTSYGMTGSWGNFTPWIFGKRSILQGININIINDLKININNSNANVGDWDTITHNYIVNNYLTNKNKYTTIDEKPGLSLSKNFNKSSANRYYKNFNISFDPKWQFFSQKNTATQSFQNFSRNYQNFVPKIGINLGNYQYGAFDENASLNYTIEYAYPNINQLYPLVDSINATYLSLGNPNLREAKTQKLSASFSHYSRRNGKNTFNFSINASIGKTSNFLTDSSFTDSIGRTRHYTINADGYKFMQLSGYLNKSFKIKKNHQLQLQFNMSNNIGETPNVVNSQWNQSKSFNSYNDLNLYYTYKDKWATNIGQSYNYYRSKQTGINDFINSNTTMTTKFSSSYAFSSKWQLGTNINYNHTSSSAAASNNFTIWNAYTSYRMLPNNNLEVKFSALDILHQNRAIYNSGSNNSITQSYSNTLQQYFMIGVAFYPRHFGKSAPQNNDID